MILQPLNLIQITSTYFCAEIVVEEGKCTYAAPILRYLIGWSMDAIKEYCNKKDWIYKCIEKTY